MVAVLAAGATISWAAMIVGGHRADHIGTFQPVSQRLVPAGSSNPVGSTVTAQPKATTVSPAPTVSSTRRRSGDSTPTTDDNGRSHDD
jgi:hypothetical protein